MYETDRLMGCVTCTNNLKFQKKEAFFKSQFTSQNIFNFGLMQTMKYLIVSQNNLNTWEIFKYIRCSVNQCKIYLNNLTITDEQVPIFKSIIFFELSVVNI